MGSTNGHEERGRDAVADKSIPRLEDHAATLVQEADEIVSEVLSPGRTPQKKTVDRFLDGGRLERVLTLYSRAMRLDPDEPAYPWNLASTLSRLGLNDLALAFMTRAVQVAQRVGDKEWCDRNAYLALAEVALDAGETDMSLMAIARARQLEPADESSDKQIHRLLAQVQKASKDPTPQASLARALGRL